jgi:hypothetical protein
MIAAQTDGTVTGEKFTATSALPKHKDAGLETPSVLIAGSNADYPQSKLN